MLCVYSEKLCDETVVSKVSLESPTDELLLPGNCANLFTYFIIQCFDAVGWVTGMVFGLRKVLYDLRYDTEIALKN